MEELTAKEERDDERQNDIILKVNVGRKQSKNANGSDSDELNHVLEKLNKSISKEEKKKPTNITKNTTTNIIDLSATISKILLLNMRDQGQSKLASSFTKYKSTVLPHPEEPTRIEKALYPGILNQICEKYKNNTSTGNTEEQYPQLQQQLSDKTLQSDILEKQWLSAPIVSALEVPQTRLLVQNMIHYLRGLHSTYIKSNASIVGQLWKLRADVLKAYSTLINDSLTAFEKEAVQIVQTYREARVEVKKQIVIAEDSSSFVRQWKDLRSSFVVWLESIERLLPATLNMQHYVEQLLAAADFQQDDPCHLREVGHMKIQLERIDDAVAATTSNSKSAPSTALISEIKEETHKVSIESKILEEDLKNTNEQIATIIRKQSSLVQIDITQLHKLSSELEKLELHKAELMKKLQPIRSAVERLAQQSMDISKSTRKTQAIDEIQEWKDRLNEFQKQCEEETKIWDTGNGRGMLYKAQTVIQEETLRTLQSIFFTSSQKIDAAGIALIRYSLFIYQSLNDMQKNLAYNTLSNVNVIQGSMNYHLQRYVVTNQEITALINQHLAVETEIQHIRDEMDHFEICNSVSEIIGNLLKTYVNHS